MGAIPRAGSAPTVRNDERAASRRPLQRFSRHGMALGSEGPHERSRMNSPTPDQIRRAALNTTRAPRNRVDEARRALRQRPKPAEREALERRLRGTL